MMRQNSPKASVVVPSGPRTRTEKPSRWPTTHDECCSNTRSVSSLAANFASRSFVTFWLLSSINADCGLLV